MLKFKLCFPVQANQTSEQFNWSTSFRVLRELPCAKVS